MLVVAALYLRLGVRETPVFSQLLAGRRIERAPVSLVLVRQWREVVLTALLRTGQMAPFYLFTVFILTDATGTLRLARGEVLTGVLIAAGASVLTVLIFGFLSDMVGRRRMVMIGAVAMLLWSYPYWMLIGSRESMLVLIAIVASLPIHDLQHAPQAALIAESFTGRLRYSGAGLGSQLASVVADAPAPLIAFALLRQLGDPRFIAILTALSALVSLVAVAALRDRSRQDMSSEYDEPAVAVTAARL